ncbi:MAG: SUMF1/EgtB/PvdO family nonheme iron enzyme, partial [Verrucomicrobiales bacterium]|nr:SUMF1/EgtB/PvdO family nonheme iron enzyme [Verrucomicrobiales bacterium]
PTMKGSSGCSPSIIVITILARHRTSQETRKQYQHGDPDESVDGIEAGDPLDLLHRWFEVAVVEERPAVLQTLMAPALIVINSSPVGADIFFGGRKLGTTPLDWENDPGVYEVVLKKEGFKEQTVQIDLKPDRNKETTTELAVWRPPVPGKPWVNSKGMRFTVRDGEWVSELPVAYKDFEEFGFLEGEPVPWTPENGGDKRQQFLVYVPTWDAQSYCEWLTQQDHRAGYLPEDFRYKVEKFSDGKLEKRIITRQPDFTAFKCVAFLQELGTLVIKSDPPGAEVFQEGLRIGVTPLRYPKAPTGKTRIDLRLPGFTYLPLVVDVKVKAETKIDVKLEESNSVVFGKRWQNPIGMVFEPLEGIDGVMMSVHETRRREFDRFVNENGKEPTHVPGFDQGGDHPAVLVSRDDAEAFCRWLTERDRRQEKIGADDVYRLPYDQEWSKAVGTLRERGATPAERGSRTLNIFPWGPEWPPPSESGNYADAGYRSKAKDAVGNIEGYSDAQIYTAPVAQFRPKGSFYDLSGNVWEWVADDYGGADLEMGALGVLRGGSWRSFEREDLGQSRRRAELPEEREDTIGFRCVLAKVDVELDVPPTMPIEDDD